MKVIIAGGRDFTDGVALGRATIESGFDITEVVCGGALGADRLGMEWAEAVGIPTRVFWARWDIHGKAAGPIRNREMAEYADALIAMPGGRGTANMIEEAKKRGLPIFLGSINERSERK